MRLKAGDEIGGSASDACSGDAKPYLLQQEIDEIAKQP